MADRVTDFLAQWRRERPELDPSPIGVMGRLARAEQMMGRELRDFFARYGLEPGEFDVLATLRRSGRPFSLSPGVLARSTMVTPAAVTNRLNRLQRKGFIDRRTDPDNRRTVHVSLTDAGRELVDEVVVAHLDNERRLLAPLTAEEQQHLAHLLARLLEAHGDVSVAD